ncbi:MAG: MMPL family transporter [Planctomycetota bacterium]|nr:MMPL family transporter [Planctomycetota bacterium]
MSHFFEKRDRWGNGYALWVIAAMCFVTPIAWWGLKRIDLHNDVENWLPKDDPQAKVLHWYKNHFARLDENGERQIEERMLVSWDGSALHDPRVVKFASLLNGPYFERVVTPHSVLEQMIKFGVAPNEAISRVEGVLIGTGPLKLKLTSIGAENPRKVVALLKDAARSELGIELVASDSLPQPENVVDDEPAVDVAAEPASKPEDAVADERERDRRKVAATLRTAIAKRWRDHDVQISWSGMHGDRELIRRFQDLAKSLRTKETPSGDSGNLMVQDCFFVAGSPLALSVVLSEAGKADRKSAFEAVRQTAVLAGIDESKLHMGGQPVAGHALNESVGRTGWNPAYNILQFHKRSPILFSMLIGIVLSFVMLRSWRLASLVIVAAVYTMFVSLAVVPITGGSMNMVVVVMPTLLMVLTMSAAIHVCNYWKHAAHKNLNTAVVEAVKMASVPCAMAGLTTAIGLLSLANPWALPPVRDFGLYSAIGCVISLVVVLYCLPAMLQYMPLKRPDTVEVERANWKRLGDFLSSKWKLACCCCVAVFAVCAAGLQHFRTEIKVIRYFPDDSRVVQDYNFLEENLSGIIPVDVVVRFEQSIRQDEQDVINRREENDETAELRFLQRMEIVRRIENKIRSHPEISGAISLADFQPVKEKPDTSGMGVLERLGANRSYNERNKQAMAEIRESSRESGSARSFYVIADKADDFEKPGDEKLNRAGDELWKITAQVAIMSELDYGGLTAELDELVRSELKYHPGTGHQVTGMVPLFLRTQQLVLESLIWSFVGAFAVIAVVMMWVLKNPLAGLLAMMPNLLPVGVVFGLISWGGLAVDIGTMITASVALGIAVDGTLHLLTWFRKGIESGLSRREAISAALSHCGPAMWQTSAAVGIGLLMLYWADLLLISRFGWLMAALIGAALIADVIFLPALLSGWLGGLIEGTLRSGQTQPSVLPELGVAAPEPHISPSAVESRVAQVD